MSTTAKCRCERCELLDEKLSHEKVLTVMLYAQVNSMANDLRRRDAEEVRNSAATAFIFFALGAGVAVVVTLGVLAVV